LLGGGQMASQPLSHSSPLGKWLTLLIWALGFGLQFSKSWMNQVFGLNTELFVFSVMGPLWAFLLVCGLAGLLGVFYRPAEKWSGLWRGVFVLFFTLLLALPQYDFIMVFREGGSFPPRIDAGRQVFLMAIPLVFYLLPAAVVVFAWLRRSRLLTGARALGLAFILYGLVYVPYGLWTNQMILRYSQP
jgi:hypothetical protein